MEFKPLLSWLKTKRKVMGHVCSLGIMLITIIIVFGHISRFDFTLFDDRQLILQPFHFIKDVRNLPHAFTQDAFITSGRFSNYYRPVLTSSFILDAQICLYNRPCYHISNIFFHIISTFLLYALLLRLNTNVLVATLLSLVFAVHPVLISAIAWIPGRNDIILTIFFIISFIFFLLLLKNDRKRDLFFSLLFFNLALYTKESAILLIPICFIYIRLFGYKLQRKSGLLLFIGVLISLSGYFFLRSFALRDFQGNLADQISIRYLPGLLLYVGKIIPINQSVVPVVTNLHLGMGIGVIAILSFCLYILRANKHFVFGGLWFFILILPAITQHEGRANPYFLEHRMYLPLVGATIMFASILRLTSKRATYLFTIISTIFIIFLGFLSYKRSYYYENASVFARKAVVESPQSANAYQQLGYVYQFVENNPEKAIEVYEKSLSLNDQTAHVNVNLGMIYLDRNELKRSEETMLKELEIRENDYVWLQLGRVYFAQGDMYKARDAWENAYSFSTTNVAVLINLAMAYYELNDPERAREYYYRAIKQGGLESPERPFILKFSFLEDIK